MMNLSDRATWTMSRTAFAHRAMVAEGGCRESPEPRALESGSVVVGISGARQNAAAAVAIGGRLRAFCEQERLTRVRRCALSPGELPEEALNAALQATGRSRDHVVTYVTGEQDAVLPGGLPAIRLDHHFTHAATAYLTSPFEHAAVVVCDHHSIPPVSVWQARGGAVVNSDWYWPGEGFAAVYSECAALFGFGRGQEHRMEALARLDPGDDSAALGSCFSYADGSLRLDPAWKVRVSDALAAQGPAWPAALGATVAASVQRQLGRALLAFLADIRSTLGVPRVCLGGGLFYNTHFNTLISQSGLFEETFVCPNPGNAGLAAGAALAIGRRERALGAEMVSPFLGPEYDLEEIKTTLDNCKLSYECLSEREVIDTVVDALLNGRLVGWFQGRMEWGHRALGNRSVLASPLSPYALDNLNVYLKQRDRYRALGLSVCEDDVARYFVGPSRSAWMEYEYQLRDPEQFRHVLPPSAESLRVQTIDGSSRQFRALHKAFEQASGAGVLINTSFNGFSEPIVCSPRDAVRVFFGTGLDLLVLGRFIIRK